MLSPQQPEDAGPESSTGLPTAPADSDDQQQPIIRLRVVPWDVLLTVTVTAVLVYLVTMTSWPARLFAFTDRVCPPESCLPVPYGIDYWIYPVMWGGIGVAVAASILGPFVSMLKGWYMSFWPIMAIAVITLTSVAGYAMTGFSERYWH